MAIHTLHLAIHKCIELSFSLDNTANIQNNIAIKTNHAIICHSFSPYSLQFLKKKNQRTVLSAMAFQPKCLDGTTLSLEEHHVGRFVHHPPLDLLHEFNLDEQRPARKLATYLLDSRGVAQQELCQHPLRHASLVVHQVDLLHPLPQAMELSVWHGK